MLLVFSGFFLSNTPTKNKNAKKAFLFSVGVLGIEPSQHAPKACVLPVYDTPKLVHKVKSA